MCSRKRSKGPILSEQSEQPGKVRKVKVDSTLAKGLSILETLARSPKGKGVTELSRELELSKSNTFRLLQSLTTLGYVKPTESKAYFATMKAWQIGQQVIGNLNLPELAAPQMRSLSRATGEAIYLAVPDGLSVIYIDKVESTQPIRSFTPKGGSAPIHCVGTGKALLAENYELLRDQIKDHLVKFTSKTITSIKKLDADIAETQRRGYAVDVGEYRERIFSFGAAIHAPNGEAIAAIGVSVPDVNLGGNRAEEICAAVAEAATEVSRAVARN